MAKVKRQFRIGTSGWHYEHWKKVFYPEELPKSRWLEHYAEHFDTVELNNTFYHLPKQQTVVNWNKRVPEDFLYTVKASRYITHIKRLKDIDEPLETFLQRAALLKDKLGPVLYQLPPSLHKDLDLLSNFAKRLPKKTINVFEFRHKSWYCDETWQLLARLGLTLCVHDLGGSATPRLATSDVIYIRFHGPQRYSGCYPDKELQDWADWIRESTAKAKHVFAYFNNDIGGHAVKNAQTLRRLLNG